MYFEEEGELVVLDYKTDRYSMLKNSVRSIVHSWNIIRRHWSSFSSKESERKNDIFFYFKGRDFIEPIG